MCCKHCGGILFFFLILIVENCMKQNVEHQKDRKCREDVQ